MKKWFLIALAGALQAQPEQFFNGKDLAGWHMVGPGRFVVENGLMKTEGGMGLLWYSGRKVGNETLRIVFKTTGDRDNSGVIIRMPEPPTDAWSGVHNGYEVQIDAAGDEWHMTGSIYSISRAVKRAQKPINEWNTMEIQLDGPITRITLNGELVNEYDGGRNVPERKQWFEPVRGPRPDFGFIGLQNHDPRTTVYFREVSSTPTDKSPKALTQGERDRLLSYLHATRKQLLDSVTELSPAQMTYKPAADKWSISEVLEHIALTEEYLFEYMTQFLVRSMPRPAESKLTPDRIVEMMKDRSKPATAPMELRPTGRWTGGPLVISAFRERRDKHIRWVNETREPLRSAYAQWGPEVVEVYQGLFSMAAHAERHLAQINEVKASSGFPKK